MTGRCDLCLRPMHGNRQSECADCRAWGLYWHNLTETERRLELDAMAAYAEECDKEAES